MHGPAGSRTHQGGIVNVNKGAQLSAFNQLSCKHLLVNDARITLHYIRTVYSGLCRPKVTSRSTIAIQVCPGMIAKVSKVSVVGEKLSVSRQTVPGRLFLSRGQAVENKRE